MLPEKLRTSAKVTSWRCLFQLIVSIFICFRSFMWRVFFSWPINSFQTSYVPVHLTSLLPCRHGLDCRVILPSVLNGTSQIFPST